MGFSVVVLENPSVTPSLANKLSSHVHAVHVTHSSEEARERIARSRPEAVVLDMETARLSDVCRLHQDFPLLPIICTHRIPDERLWIAGLEAGASDVCQADDAQDILTSVLRSVAVARVAAA